MPSTSIEGVVAFTEYDAVSFPLTYLGLLVRDNISRVDGGGLLKSCLLSVSLSGKLKCFLFVAD